ncbi:hypothetical protein [Pelagicoccus enzymogenes]|uniref:hypothetical protein n=1 Tax=Pelagicoccus enzymogenes TaxID=2773457 RepID=UPI002810BE03|nr:hypothetical protein [Pelagicoccus enzymogenes]
MACQLSAQEEAQPSFRVLGYGDGDFQGIFFEREGVEGDELVELVFVPDRKSRPVTLASEPRRLSFFAQSLNARGKIERRGLGEVTWPVGAERVLVVFLQKENGRDSPPEYDYLVFDESPAVWGPRCARFLNLTGVPLNAKMQRFEFPVEVGATDILCFEGEYSVPMTLELSLPWKGRKEIVYSARFVADQYSPKLLVVKPPPVAGSFKVVVETIW